MTRCFHCGEPVPAGADFAVTIAGERRAMCCPGCAAVAEAIERNGLARFYAYREAPSRRPERDAAQDDYRVYDRPALRERLTADAGEGQRELRCTVGGLTCAACAWLLGTGLRRLEGVVDAGVNPLCAEAWVRFDAAKIEPSRVLAEIAELGFDPRPRALGGPSASARHRERDAAERRAALKRLAVAGFGAAQVMTFGAALYLGAAKHMSATFESFFELVSLLVATPVVLYAGAPIFAAAWGELRRGRLGMDVPVALAVGGALAASLFNALRGRGTVYFDSATMFVFFLTLGRFLEARARHEAGSVFDALADLLPLAALRRREGRLEAVGTLELERGDRVVVSPGEALPADGVLMSAAELDEAILSGESRPQQRRPGEAALAGSLNAGSAPVEIEVTGLGAETYVGRIGGMLAQATTARPEFVRTADRVAAWFVAAVLAATAVVTGIWWHVQPGRAFDVALAMLVATCPCALSLATPAAFSVALAALARRGLLLRSTRALERIGDVNCWVFDKTGTLTEGALAIARVDTFGDLAANACLEAAAALDAGVEHPLARAFASARASARAPEPGEAPAGPFALAEDVRFTPGQGVAGNFAGRRLRLGSRRFVLGSEPPGTDRAAGPRLRPLPPAAQASASAPAAGESAVAVYLGDERGALARFTLEDALRPSAAPAVAALRREGQAVSIVSGDDARTVAATAAALGGLDWHAAQTPDRKLAFVEDRQRRGHVVAAVGDGINDVPLLARADLSIAVVEGSRLAQASADVVFTGTDLTLLPLLVEAGRSTRAVIRQNLTWAVLYNSLALPAAALGLLAPWAAALGMSVSSLVVVMNALRLRRLLGARPAAPKRTESSLRLHEATA